MFKPPGMNSGYSPNSFFLNRLAQNAVNPAAPVNGQTQAANSQEVAQEGVQEGQQAHRHQGPRGPHGGRRRGRHRGGPPPMHPTTQELISLGGSPMGSLSKDEAALTELKALLQNQGNKPPGGMNMLG